MKLELRGITKRFGALVANDHIDLTVEPGEIHCLLGENGAGKTTLMNVLYGLYQADEGEIVIDDAVQHFAGPGDAMAAGIGMVHQHFMLIPVFTVAENVVLGHEQTKGVRLDLDAARTQVREIASRFGFHVDPDSVVEDLPVGVQQRVEIIKALSREAKILVFDEPTAVLTPQETDEFMAIMRQLRDSGAAIVFITHKLREVREVADRITVVRRGKIVGEAHPGASDAELASLMVGRPVELTVHKAPPQYSDALLEVSGLTVSDPGGAVLVDDVSFSVRGGEVLIVAGVQGNGQTELGEALAGLTPATGSVRLDGVELLGRSVRDVLDAGVGYVPEDRSTDGLIGSFTVAENLILDRVSGPPFVRGGALQLGVRDEFARKAVEEFDIRTQGIGEPAGRLSGGNQQKVVLSKWIFADPDVLILDEPTRGIDIGAKYEIYTIVNRLADEGKAVILISSELPELIGVCDRIYTLSQGSVTGEVVRADATQEHLMHLMTMDKNGTTR